MLNAKLTMLNEQGKEGKRAIPKNHVCLIFISF